MSRHDVCLLHSLVFFFPPSSQYTVMYSSQPFKVKCHLDRESCFFGRLDAHFHWGGCWAAIHCCSKGTKQQWKDMLFRKPLNRGVIRKHYRSVTLTSWLLTSLFASCHRPRSVDATGFMTNRQLEERTEKLILCSCCICANKGLGY